MADLLLSRAVNDLRLGQALNDLLLGRALDNLLLRRALIGEIQKLSFIMKVWVQEIALQFCLKDLSIEREQAGMWRLDNLVFYI